MRYVPEFKGEIEGYVVNYLAREHWKVSSTMPRDDCMQEAYCVFLRCKRKYANTVTEPKHFMALFKTAWFRCFTDLANENTEHREFVSMSDASEGEPGSTMYDMIGCTDNDGALATAVRQAPREVSMVLALFLSAPQELLDLALATWRHGDRRQKSNGSRRINQMLGLPEDRDTMQEVTDYFTS